MSEIDPRIREHKHRLEKRAYIGPKTLCVTISVCNREVLFSNPDVVSKLLEILKAKAGLHKCDVPIYCFMPDHLHLLVRGLEDGSQPKKAVDAFKLSAGIWLHTNRPSSKLQKSYYDHIIRCGEDWRHQAQYIALNPVRAGLAESPFDFAFTGCIGADRTEMLQEIFFG